MKKIPFGKSGHPSRPHSEKPFSQQRPKWSRISRRNVDFARTRKSERMPYGNFRVSQPQIRGSLLRAPAVTGRAIWSDSEGRAAGMKAAGCSSF